MRGKSSRLRTAALLALGALLLHQLRYLGGYGADASEMSAAHGHGYLTFLGPVVALLVTAAAAHLLYAATMARHPSGPHASRRFGRIWLGASLALIAIYVAQESIEGVVAVGHPGGVAGVVGGGGWWALVFAPAVGAFLALMLKGADAVISGASRVPSRVACATGGICFSPARFALPRLDVAALNLASRAPPQTSG